MAGSHSRHIHHTGAALWFDSAGDSSLFFCRFTQLGLLRLLTNAQVMGEEIMTQRGAWAAYHRWFEDGRVAFLPEPTAASFERVFQNGHLAGLITFDRSFPRLDGLDIELLSGSV